VKKIELCWSIPPWKEGTEWEKVRLFNTIMMLSLHSRPISDCLDHRR
jgi:hypothetical protein